MHSHATAVRAVCGVVAQNAAGEVLLIQRVPDGSWGLPGGGVETGETWSRAAIRECVEETGWEVRLTGLLGVYSDPETQTWRYPDGRTVQFFGVVFTGRVTRHVAEPDDEVLAAGFFPIDGLPGPLFAPDRPVLEDLRTGQRCPHIG